MNKYKKQYKVIERNLDLSENQKIYAMENLLNQLNSQIGYIDEQYKYHMAKSKTQTIAHITAILSLIAGCASLFTAAMSCTADESLAFNALMTTLASAGVFIPSWILIGGEFGEPKPFPFTKESKFYHELKNMQKTINTLQFEIDSRKKIEEAKQQTMM